MGTLSGHFEAKKIAWRQTKDGLVLALSVHPDDMPKEMALSALNTRYMIAFSEIGDDEKPVTRTQESVANGSTKYRPFSTLPLSQQCAIRCQDKDFQRFLHEQYGLAEAEDVRLWVHKYCQIASRAMLDDPACAFARQQWGVIEKDYQANLTDRKFADIRR